jgi:hypothetical protein
MTGKRLLEKFYDWDTMHDASLPWLAPLRWIAIGIALAGLMHWIAPA